MTPSTHVGLEHSLLRSSPKRNNDFASQAAISPTTQTAVKVLFLFRTAIGAASLVAPRFSCGLFELHVPAEQALLVRMIGTRDAAIEDVLATAEDKGTGNDGRR